MQNFRYIEEISYFVVMKRIAEKILSAGPPKRPAVSLLSYVRKEDDEGNVKAKTEREVVTSEKRQVMVMESVITGAGY